MVIDFNMAAAELAKPLVLDVSDFILDTVSRLIKESFGGEVNTLSDEEYSAIFDSAKREMLAYIDSNKPEGATFNADEGTFTVSDSDGDKRRAVERKAVKLMEDTELLITAWLDCKADDVQEFRAEYPGCSMSEEEITKFLYSN